DTVKFPDDADNLRYDPATKRVYIGYGDGAIGVIDATTNKRLAENFELGVHPESFQLEQKGPRIFAQRLPELAASLGKSMKEFRKATAESDHPTAATQTPPAAAARTCASCRTPLDADWTHCPRCGSPATAPTTAARP